MVNPGVAAATSRLIACARLRSAADESRTLRRTRLDRGTFHYVRPATGGEPEPRVVFEGVSLSPAAEAFRYFIIEAAEEFLVAHDTPLLKDLTS